MFILSIISSFFIDPNKEYTQDSKYYRFLLYTCTKIAVFFARIRIHVRGLAYVPKKGRYLLVGNHKSNFDPILSWETAFGKIIRRLCFLGIDRDNPRKALQTVEQAATFLKEDKFSIGVYPEGTRNWTDEPLLPFHTGLFKIAKKANVPIVVVITKNNEKIAKNFPFKGTDVYYDFVGVIPADEVNKLSNAEIGERVSGMMLHSLSDLSFDDYETLKDIRRKH